MNLAAAEERLRSAERRVKEVKEDKAVAHARGASLAQEHVQVHLVPVTLHAPVLPDCAAALCLL